MKKKKKKKKRKLWPTFAFSCMLSRLKCVFWIVFAVFLLHKMSFKCLNYLDNGHVSIDEKKKMHLQHSAISINICILNIIRSVTLILCPLRCISTLIQLLLWQLFIWFCIWRIGEYLYVWHFMELFQYTRMAIVAYVLEINCKYIYV